MRWLLRLFLWLICLYLGKQIIVYNYARYIEEQLEHNSGITLGRDVTSYLSANAHTKLAEQAYRDGHFTLSEQMALHALSNNISSGAPASYLLGLYSSQQRNEDASIVADIAGQLWPHHTYTRSRLADYWLTQQRIDRLIPEWNILLIRNPSLYKNLFPALSSIIEKKEYQSLFQPYLTKPPIWWNDFFLFICNNATLDLVNKVYQLRLQATPQAITEKENLAYTNRLIREKKWQQAYDIWEKNLHVSPNKSQTPSNLLYDGEFETTGFNSGFDWQIENHPVLTINKDRTYGINGRQALSIHLKKLEPINFQHIYHIMILPSGQYHFNMRYRLDNFKTSKGLQWHIRCIDDLQTTLFSSPLLKGQQTWQTFSTTFNVPPTGCPVQLLRLEAASAYRHEQFFDGTIWFDNNKVENTSERQD